MKTTLIQQWKSLIQIKSWTRDLLPGETDQQTREALFKAEQAIGFAMLYLEEVEFRTNGAYSEEK